jgi:hypothetical protein
MPTYDKPTSAWTIVEYYFAENAENHAEQIQGRLRVNVHRHQIYGVRSRKFHRWAAKLSNDDWYPNAPYIEKEASVKERLRKELEHRRSKD